MVTILKGKGGKGISDEMHSSSFNKFQTGLEKYGNVAEKKQ